MAHGKDVPTIDEDTYVIAVDLSKNPEGTPDNIAQISSREVSGLQSIAAEDGNALVVTFTDEATFMDNVIKPYYGKVDTIAIFTHGSTSGVQTIRLGTKVYNIGGYSSLPVANNVPISRVHDLGKSIGRPYQRVNPVGCNVVSGSSNLANYTARVSSDIINRRLQSKPWGN